MVTAVTGLTCCPVPPSFLELLLTALNSQFSGPKPPSPKHTQRERQMQRVLRRARAVSLSENRQLSMPSALEAGRAREAELQEGGSGPRQGDCTCAAGSVCHLGWECK